MPEVVVFRLAAPLGAFGEIAVGERRGSARRPSHSLVTGLIAGALGLPRADDGHEAIAAGFHLAVRVEAPGTALADYHTAQTPPTRRGLRYATRRAELANRHALGTVISRRDYRADCAFTLALWPTGAPGAPAPGRIVAALAAPAFIPFAGRRACPLGEPMRPALIDADSVVEALELYDRETRPARDRLAEAAWWLRAPRHRRSQPRELAFDAALATVAGVSASHSEIRRDQLVNRARWQFDRRTELVATLDDPGATP
ncbi:type I-E CRISPR-associated protein Cas5/CasD [Segnochrobactraceae bacterium EtOH-i3]